jgi:GntR family transcriptional regulator
MISFALNPQSGVPIYRQIQDQIRYGIASGCLVPGEQLPTVRALAVELAVNPNTVIRAYSDLERQGVLATEQGTGTFISAQPALTVDETERRGKLTALCAEFLSHAGRYGFSPAEVLRAIQEFSTESQQP